MAAVAPCPHGWGCHCRSGYAGYGSFQANARSRYQQAQAPPVPMFWRVQQLLLSFKSPEEKFQDAQQFIMQMPAHEVGSCLHAILAQAHPVPWFHTLSVQMMGELLHLHPATVAGELTGTAVPFIFAENADLNGAAAFFRDALWTKEQLGQDTRSMMGAFEAILLRRTRHDELQQVKPCLARSWLVQIWKDVPSARPSPELTISCSVQWLADPYHALAGKGAIIDIIGQEVGRRSPVDAEAWLLWLIFQEIWRQPMQHSPDLQQILYLLPRPPSPTCVRGLLASLAADPQCLMTLWACLSRWSPQAPCMAAPVWKQQGHSPLHDLLRSMLVAFAQLPQHKTLCQSALMSLAALATSNSITSSQAPAFLLMLYCEGPIMPPDVWLPLVPSLDQISPYSPHAAELSGRLKALASGSFFSAPHMGQMAPTAAPHFNTAPGAGSNFYGGGMAQASQGHGWPQYHQNRPVMPPTAQGAHGAVACSVQPVETATEFAPLPPGQSTPVPLKPPSVGLQNTNNTCYMNSFVQALFVTDALIYRIYSFDLKLKANPSKIDKADYEFGKQVVELLRKQFAKMALTKHKHTDIWDILQSFPADYRSGVQQDVTEAMRFVFDKLGGYDQALLKEVFGGEMLEKIQCKECGNIKVRKETFTDLVVPVPTAAEVEESGHVPTAQELLNNFLKIEDMDDSENLVECPVCQRKTGAVKWSEVSAPPSHLCLCLNRFTFNMEKRDFTKEKTPVKVDAGLFIGEYEYELYHAIIHSGKDASSGHYYAMGKRSEPVPGGDGTFYTMDDSQIKPANVSLLAGKPPEELTDDNTYVLFFRCQQAPPTPEFRVPSELLDYVKQQDKKMRRWH